MAVQFFTLNSPDQEVVLFVPLLHEASLRRTGRIDPGEGWEIPSRPRPEMRAVPARFASPSGATGH